MSRLRNDKGFTLVELMVVIIIIGILAAIGYQKFGGAIKQSRCAGAQTAVGEAKTAMDLYLTKNPSASAVTVSDLITAGYFDSADAGSYVPTLAFANGGAVSFTSTTSDGKTFIMSGTHDAINKKVNWAAPSGTCN